MQFGLDDENEYKTFMGKPLDKYPFRIPQRRLDDDINQPINSSFTIH